MSSSRLQILPQPAAHPTVERERANVRAAIPARSVPDAPSGRLRCVRGSDPRVTRDARAASGGAASGGALTAGRALDPAAVPVLCGDDHTPPDSPGREGYGAHQLLRARNDVEGGSHPGPGGNAEPGTVPGTRRWSWNPDESGRVGRPQPLAWVPWGPRGCPARREPQAGSLGRQLHPRTDTAAPPAPRWQVAASGGRWQLGSHST